MSAAIRIQKEFARMTTDPPTGCSAAMADNNLYQWTASITAPEVSKLRSYSNPFMIRFELLKQ